MLGRRDIRRTLTCSNGHIEVDQLPLRVHPRVCARGACHADIRLEAHLEYRLDPALHRVRRRLILPPGKGCAVIRNYCAVPHEAGFAAARRRLLCVPSEPVQTRLRVPSRRSRRRAGQATAEWQARATKSDGLMAEQPDPGGQCCGVHPPHQDRCRICDCQPAALSTAGTRRKARSCTLYITDMNSSWRLTVLKAVLV
eukprot:CAMPEP_0179880316 /NCGR_PEP_ID=MMETSP0982-20121206/26729_1 /TAXON_ID=483367 /ORGANISM="non described non described, Strain CCMP 2436" /LENGTH=197 /DNA_ID=CAMNT_0021773915 /DNA_START=702 /DNA_END=1295 /DNA_ORIENTATION=+